MQHLQRGGDVEDLSYEELLAVRPSKPKKKKKKPLKRDEE